MSTLKIHNWERWQSYRSDRGQPPWIKIHREVMRHIEWVSLTDAQRGQLVAIWLLAADHNGVIPASPSIIKKLCHLDSEPDLNMFINNGFIDGDIMASDWRQSDSPEKSRDREDKSRVDKIQSAPALLASLGIPENLANDFIQHRKSKKAAITKTALDGIQREADKAKISMQDALKVCCERGWVGFKAEWYAQSNAKPEKFDAMQEIHEKMKGATIELVIN